MTNPYRAMCAELADLLHEHTCLYEGHQSELVARARALLALPEPPELTDEELLRVTAKALEYKSIPSDETCLTVEAGELLAFARAVLARWSHHHASHEQPSRKGRKRIVLNRALALKRFAVALTPMAGALAFPLIVPVVLMRFGLPAAMLSAVLIGTAWFVVMLRTAEMAAVLQQQVFRDPGMDGNDLPHRARAVLARWGRPTPQPVAVSEPLPSNCIDHEHSDHDRELLDIFYVACCSEARESHFGSATAEEITLRGIKAVLARSTLQPHPRGHQ